mmetsp:Transcript_27421/g.63355  ORF Transcript_27421/g.63355 Transcript_27421/m.63355 type:complete len:97 (+) Transcript_27421:1399-1689(+)
MAWCVLFGHAPDCRHFRGGEVDANQLNEDWMKRKRRWPGFLVGKLPPIQLSQHEVQHDPSSQCSKRQSESALFSEACFVACAFKLHPAQCSLCWFH